MDPVSVFQALYDTKCLKFGQYNLKSGLVAPYYANLRRLPLYPKLMEAVVTQVVEKFLNHRQILDSDEPIICGVPYGAIPLASAIAYSAQLPYLFERKEAKGYGDLQCLMDDFDTGKRQRVILIEDVICSGESILEAVRNLEKQDIKVEFVICIIDREENGVRLLLEKWGIRVVSLYNMSAILRVLEATGRITSEQFNHTRQWMAQSQFVSIGLDPSMKCRTESITATPVTNENNNGNNPK